MNQDTKENPVCLEEAHGEPPPTLASLEALAKVASIFSAMGDPSRLWLLERLYRQSACVSELAQESGDGMSTVSQRLKLLRSEGLVLKERRGKHIYYALKDAHVHQLIQNALEHALEDEPKGSSQ